MCNRCFALIHLPNCPKLPRRVEQLRREQQEKRERGRHWRAKQKERQRHRETQKAISGYAEKAGVSYSGYLQTDHWKRVRLGAMKRAWFQCEKCGSEQEIQVHHLTYDRLWHERPGDLIVLCRECHLITHGLLDPGAHWFQEVFMAK